VEVSDWLGTIGLPQYARNFENHDVDDALLPTLTADDLREMGVVSVGHRRLILNAIATLSRSREPATLQSRVDRTEPSPNVATGERRPVTVLFADLCGFTRLSEELEDEALHAIIARYLTMAEDAIKANAGTVVKQIGDAVMGVFGVPVARDEDIANAARAALAIQNGMSGLSEASGRRLDAHVGLAAGEAIVGGMSEAPLSVIGASVNLAARVTSAAQPGEALVSDGLARQLSERFLMHDQGFFAAKGIDDPVRVWRLIGERPEAQSIYPFVGRKAELSQIEALLRGGIDSRSGVQIHLRGEPGIGKSRLVEKGIEIAAEMGFESIVARAMDFGAGHARHPLRQMSDALLSLRADDDRATRGDAVARVLPELEVDSAGAPLLFELADIEVTDDQRTLVEAMSDVRRTALRNEVVRALVRRRTRRGPLLLVIEDVQWADDELRDAVINLLDITDNAVFAVLTTSRPEDERFYSSLRDAPRRTPLATLDLGPLHPDEAERLAQAVDASEEVRRRCLERAAGNPLFLDQLLRNADELIRSDLPASLRGLILARIDRLGPRDRAAIQAASALGERFDPDALLHVLGGPRVDLSRLARAGMLRPTGAEVAFGHALIREAAYRSLLRESRQALHRRAADWFEDRDLLLHAAHLAEAGAPEAAAAYRRAAEDRLARYRTSEALNLAQTGLSVSRPASDRAGLTLLMARICLELGRARESETTFAEALTLDLDPRSECSARIGLASALRILDNITGALDQVEAAQRLAEQNDWPDLMSQCHHLRGNLLFPTGRVDECHAQHALALQMAERAGSQEEIARALGGLGDAEYLRGRMIAAGNYYRRSVDAGVQAGLGRIEASNRPMAALATMCELRLADALREAEFSVERARLMIQPRAELIGRHSCAFVLAELGRDAEALGHLEEARRITGELEAWRFESENLFLIAGADLRAGRRKEARAALATGLDIARRSGMAYFGAITLTALTRTEPDPKTRHEMIDEAEQLLATVALSHNHWFGRRELIELGWELRDPQLIDFHASALDTYSRRESGPLVEAIIRRGRALARALRGERSSGLADEIASLADMAEARGSILLLIGLEECRTMTGW
jgi:class 3 adenylate cyclase/tetratricopeptide (TPR) repeat protein